MLTQFTRRCKLYVAKCCHTQGVAYFYQIRDGAQIRRNGVDSSDYK